MKTFDTKLTTSARTALIKLKKTDQLRTYDKVLSEWLVSHDIELGLTLTFKNKVKTSSTALKKLFSLNNRLRKKLYGQHALKLDKFKEGKNMSFFCVIEEHKDEGLHVHAVLIKLPSNLWTKEIDFKAEVINTWEKVTNSYNNWQSGFETIQDAKNYSSYCLKLQKTDIDNVYIFCWDARH